MNRLRWGAIGALVALFAICAIGARFQSDAAFTIDNVHWAGNPLPPCFIDAHSCGGHLLGTDENGRDVLARLFAGTALALELAATNVAMALAIGLFAGVAASGRARRWVAPIANGFIAFPLWIIAVLFVIATTGRDSTASSWFTLAIGYGCFMWPLVAGAVLRKRSVLEAAFDVAVPILLADAVVNFLGYGVQPPQPTLGNMLVHGESNIEVAPWVVIVPTALLTLIVFLCRLAAIPSLNQTPDQGTEHPSPAHSVTN
ncbi:MAG TPA: hypothetical protein VFL13_07485 [Candidatus Baltobacteraceae bacterium]|nr:hypothetical protein [Candidatus Baltobacteraceae bacterium]